VPGRHHNKIPAVKPPLVEFAVRGRSATLAGGESFALPREHGFRDTPANALLQIVAEVEQGRPWLDAVTNRFATANPWLCRIVTHPSRTAFFPLLPPVSISPVLDIGAGWGQISRPLARMRPVVALEPVAERLSFIRAAAKQDHIDHQLAFVEADYFDVAFTTRFSAICAIGVLEWAGAFQSAGDPQELQRSFLRKARQELAPGGVLLLGIENRIGLKYLLGAADDHIEHPHIACLPAPLARERFLAVTNHALRSFTYSENELRALLRDAGFAHCEFFAAFPDYKLPVHVVSLADHGRAWNDLVLREPLPPEHNGYNGTPFSPDFAAHLALRTRELAQAGLAHTFVPSFFVRAS
jgi:SAM-dependent methyltransferase